MHVVVLVFAHGSLCSGQAVVQELSAALAAAVGSARDMPRHFCELQLEELGLRCVCSNCATVPTVPSCRRHVACCCRYMDRVEALGGTTNAVLWHPLRWRARGSRGVF